MLLATLALPACQQADNSAPAPQQSAVAGPEAKPGLSASGGLLVLPVVKGRPAAAYFTLTNASENTAELAAIHIEGAISSEMHETKGGTMVKLGSLPVGPGETLKFAWGGKHIMVFELAEDMKPGGTAEMTLSFADGDKLSAPLAIEEMGGMEHMDHGAGN